MNFGQLFSSHTIVAGYYCFTLIFLLLLIIFSSFEYWVTILLIFFLYVQVQNQFLGPGRIGRWNVFSQNHWNAWRKKLVKLLNRWCMLLLLIGNVSLPHPFNSEVVHSSVCGHKLIKLFSCSTQLNMKIPLLINMKMPTIVGIFIFISWEIFMLSYF